MFACEVLLQQRLGPFFSSFQCSATPAVWFLGFVLGLRCYGNAGDDAAFDCPSIGILPFYKGALGLRA